MDLEKYVLYYNLLHSSGTQKNVNISTTSRGRFNNKGDRESFLFQFVSLSRTCVGGLGAGNIK